MITTQYQNYFQLRDEVAIGFQKHRVLINKMLKENPSLLPHIINFLMNSYGEHIGFYLADPQKSDEHKNSNGEASPMLNALMKKNTSYSGKISSK